MVPTGFDEENAVLGRPDQMSDDECSPLSVYKGRTTNGFPVVVSCWKMTKEEKDELLRTGRVWLTVFGDSMPPVALTGTSPFLLADQSENGSSHAK